MAARSSSVTTSERVEPWPDLPEDPGFHFHQEDIALELPDQARTAQWLGSVISEEGLEPGEVNIIFCSDDFLLDLNQRFLQHDTLTDIITFPYEGERVGGDIFISAERVKENAVEFGVAVEDELDRVMVHGVLHLCGYEDDDLERKARMRSREDHYLGKR